MNHNLFRRKSVDNGICYTNLSRSLYLSRPLLGSFLELLNHLGRVNHEDESEEASTRKSLRRPPKRREANLSLFVLLFVSNYPRK